MERRCLLNIGDSLQNKAKKSNIMEDKKLDLVGNESEVAEENLRVLIPLLIVLCSPIALAYLMHILTK